MKKKKMFSSGNIFPLAFLGSLNKYKQMFALDGYLPDLVRRKKCLRKTLQTSLVADTINLILNYDSASETDEIIARGLALLKPLSCPKRLRDDCLFLEMDELVNSGKENMGFRQLLISTSCVPEEKNQPALFSWYLQEFFSPGNEIPHAAVHIPPQSFSDTISLLIFLNTRYPSHHIKKIAHQFDLTLDPKKDTPNYRIAFVRATNFNAYKAGFYGSCRLEGKKEIELFPPYDNPPRPDLAVINNWDIGIQ